MIEPAQLFGGRVDCGVQRGRVGDIRASRNDDPAVRSNLVARGCQSLGAPREECDVRALLGEPVRDRQAESVAGPR